ncbi:MAG: nitrogenase, partial [Candidatus Methanofastidiosa archaeon]|nr:nitrogenase [Candidatus Methanofastidiosa archaeon]
AKHDDGECPQCSSTLSDQENDIPISVSDQQNHEVLNLLTRLKPDLYIGRHGGLAVWPTKMGIPAIMVNDEYVAFGYDGTIDFGYRIVDTLTNTSLVRNISKRVKLPYTKWWFEQDPFKFL